MRSDPRATRLFARIVHWAALNHPFYRAFWDDPTLDIPILTRDIIQRDSAAFLAGKTPTGFTSGSTGQPVPVAWDKKRLLMENRDYGQYMSYTGGLRETVRLVSRATRKFGDNVLDVTRPLPEQLAFVRQRHVEHGATEIVTYPSNADQLCRYVIDKQLDLTFIKRFGLMSESVEPAQFEQVRRAFPGVDCWCSYSATEVGIIAILCPFDPPNYHVMAHKLGVEVLNDANEPCAPGETGRVVITDFMNIYGPFIRYDIGDLAVPGECGCDQLRLPTLSSIVGKVTGSFLHRDGHRVMFTTLTAALRRSPIIGRFQVIQHSIDRFTVRYLARPGAEDPTLHARLLAILDDEAGVGVGLELVDDPALGPGANGKFQFAVSHL